MGQFRNDALPDRIGRVDSPVHVSARVAPGAREELVGNDAERIPVAGGRGRFTGPEGGLEEKEVRQARETGLQVCTLGKRILRCETAPLCALSAVMYDAGEF